MNDFFVNYVRMTEGIVRRTPKVHMWRHMVFEARWKGNPTMDYAAWYDEHLNGIVKNIARGLHAATFEKSMLHKFPQAVAHQPPQFKTRRAD